MKTTLEDKKKRVKAIMDELSQQLVETNEEIIKARQEVDECFAELTINNVRRQNMIGNLRRGGSLCRE